MVEPNTALRQRLDPEAALRGKQARQRPPFQPGHFAIFVELRDLQPRRDVRSRRRRQADFDLPAAAGVPENAANQRIPAPIPAEVDENAPDDRRWGRDIDLRVGLVHRRSMDLRSASGPLSSALPMCGPECGTGNFKPRPEEIIRSTGRAKPVTVRLLSR